MSRVWMSRMSRLPKIAIEFAVGTVIVLVHLAIASRLDRTPRAWALASPASHRPAPE